MAPRPERVIPLVVATALFMETMDSTILATALPVIARDLGVDAVALKLAVTSYLVGLAIVVPASGWIADRMGSRTTFRIALALFLVASVGCATSDGLTGFVCWRFVQGTGAALMTPVGRLVIVRTIPKDRLVTALATLTIPSLMGPVIGPPLGGFLATYADWRWIFVVNIPIGLLGVMLSGQYFDNERGARLPLDWKGLAFAAVALTGLILGAASLGRHVAPLSVTAAAILVGTTATALYVRHSRRTEAPLLDLRLLSKPTFDAGVAGGALFRLGVGASAFLVPLMLQIGLGLDAFTSGLITFSSALGALLMKFMAPRILARAGFRTVLIFNGLAASVLIASMALVGPATPHAAISAILLVAGLSRSLEFTSLHAISYADIDHGHAPAATGLASVGQQVSLGMGVAAGALALELAQRFNGHTTPMTEDFAAALVAVSLLSGLCVLRFLPLPSDAGAALSRGSDARRQGATP